MYYYPFFLLTDDCDRNRKLADLVASEQKKYSIAKLSLYDNLPASSQHKALYDLVDLEKGLANTLCDVLRANYNVLNTNLPKIDHWRLEEKAKRLLGTMRNKAQSLAYPNQDTALTDLLDDAEKWGETTMNSPVSWNNLVLARVADIHRNVFRFVETVRITIFSKDTEAAATVATVVTILDAWRVIAREVKEYTRLISSL